MRIIHRSTQSSVPFMFYELPGTVPGPESLLHSLPPNGSFSPVSTELLLASTSPSKLDELKKTCKSSMPCVHDTLASGIPDVGQQALDAETQFQNLALIYGKLASIHRTQCSIICDLY